MSGFVYLMKNGDLYKLGCTTNLKSEASKMKPGEIISSFKTNDPKSFEVRLLRLYKKKRIPDTNYFRLSESEVNNCKKHLEGKSNFPKSLNDELRIGLNGSLLFAAITFLISFFINKMLILSLSLSIFFSSLPMWTLAIIGSFGGYDTDDLALFSTVSNRLKGLSIGISMISVSYVLYTFSRLSIPF
ncbi:GIY-YIG nuclease family protein [Prochlorococcus marinus]|uniref:GIY-YIG nuclease family protein n=1 Tax=Prochlorococcus marinus TaxID=1219 RepID=UPI0022B3D321|nr:GIY-YIG nuclease family protein [Prochlorococcus marinus]